MKHRISFWEKELYNRVYDVIVVGAGLTGISAAYFYKKERPSASVLVIDRDFYPIGASTRNAGFACIGTIGEHLADLEIDTETQLKERIKNRYNGLSLLRQTLGDDAIDYQHTGGWEVFMDKEEFLKSKNEIDRFNTWMLELTGETKLYKVGTYLGIPAIFNRHEGMLHPGKMIKKLYELALKCGIEVRWNTPIKNVCGKKGEIETESGIKIKADHVVITTNAFTKKLLPKIDIKPGRGYVFVTKKIPLLQWKGTFHYNKGYVYFRNVGAQRMLVGGGRNIDNVVEETFDFGVNPTIKEYLINVANEILQLPKGWSIEQEWSGIMGFTDSKKPIVRQVSQKCTVVAGLSGMGVALGMQLGKMFPKHSFKCVESSDKARLIHSPSWQWLPITERDVYPNKVRYTVYLLALFVQ